MSDKEAEHILNNHKINDSYYLRSSSKRPNYILIIVESLSSEYCGFLNNGNGYTPFLDSLSKHCIVFDQFYANGKQSIEGIPAILSGLPCLMDEPFVTSTYADNRINSMASLLKQVGYNTSFYHGGKNGTMNFDLYTKKVGFDRYIGQNEYTGNKEDNDGHWGIYDEPFLQFFATQLNKEEQPYLSVLFTLSSHQPYIIPNKYKNILKDGEISIHRSIRYTDLSLRNFFSTMQTNQSLDSNTYVIITADHTGPNSNPNYNSRLGQYKIPLLIYNNSKTFSPKIVNQLSQQINLIDIICTPMTKDENLWSAKSHHFATNYFNNDWMMVNDSVEIEFNGDKIYNFKSKDNKYPTSEELFLKAYIQLHNSKMIKNQLIK
ncbi:MAG: LTA synthase family protein [Bacteroidetes bacterium]|nr:LTA synthase family protein [Bacteroidota bacterium]